MNWYESVAVLSAGNAKHVRTIVVSDDLKFREE